MRKRFVAFMLAVTMLFSCTAVAFGSEGLKNFVKKQDYTVGQFSDIAETSWYAENVQTAYELGLMNGNSATTFNPGGNITVAETLAIACRLNNIYYGGSEEFVQGAPWYQVYVDYAIEHQIITLGEYSGYTAKATRAQFVSILAAAIPQEALQAVNAITEIPDVSRDASFAESVYLFYNAGILTGSDKYGTFKPESNISRSEVSAIITRIVATSLRKVFTLEKAPVAVTSISLNTTTLNLMVGKTANLTATVAPDNATNKTITWTSSNPAVASVVNGTVQAVGVGTATIQAKAGEKTANCSVTVSERRELKQSDISIQLKIPRNGTFNNYAELIVKNYSNDTLTLPKMLSINGYLCNYNSTYDLPGGMMVTIPYYRAIIPSQRFDDKHYDMYLDNNSIGYVVMQWNGEQYYAEYGVNGITLFYRGNVNGPA